MKIIKVARPYVGREEVKAVTDVLLSGRYISGPKVEEFENKFSQYIGTKYSVAVNSGTASLHVALAVLGIGAGDEVIVPPLTFFSTVSVVLYQDAIPVFADINPDSYCLDPEDLTKKISKRTKAVIPVHLFGNSAEMDEIMKIAEKYGIKVIEDAAQAHGTEYNGKKVGSIGDIGCFSFFATKHMTTGEGGMLVTNNRRWADLARIIRSHGMSNRDSHDYLGYNYRMNEIAAAMGIVQLKRLDDLNKKRIGNSLYLIDKLKNSNLDWLTLPKLQENIMHTFFWCPILVDEAKLGITTGELINILLKNGIETRHRYQQPLYKQKAFIKKCAYLERLLFDSKFKVDCTKIRLENVEKIAGKIIGLPNHPDLSKNELDYIIKILNTIK